MNYPDSVQYLYSLGNEIKTAKFGLETMQVMIEALGHPERAYRVVHVAGTNGKGSTCAMIESVLRVAGLRTGLYTSPHLIEPTERIQVEGVRVSPAEFTEAFHEVHHTAEGLLENGRLENHPTYFETVTLMAFLLFRKHAVEIAVIEVGLGGRLDATNVVEPELCVITPVDYDHESFLGKSLESIAGEKAGIIKAGVPVIVGPQREAAARVIEERAIAVGSIVYRSSDWAGYPLAVPLLGAHQVENARTAAMALEKLGAGRAAIEEGIAKVRWPGRLEPIAHEPPIILDGAHNPAGARALERFIREECAGKRIGMIYGTMRDKSFEEISGILFPLVDDLVLTAPDQARALRPEAMLEFVEHPQVRTAATLQDALALPHAVDVLFVTGSLYLVGEARGLLVQ
jgi:dihydrofolate synthase/folylpolyglutamate synthase